MDRAENVCSNPDILVKEIEHLGKVLRYNNYPQWLIDKRGKSEKSGPLIHPDTGHEVKKQFFISVPYFPGLSESFKKIFRYTTIQVCFKGVNTLKSMLMHPKDKISIDQKKDIVYHWECQADGCKSAYVGETSRALGERVKEHCKSSTSAILKTVLNITILYPEYLISILLTRIPPRSPRRTRKPYTFEGWTLISTEILVKCQSHTALTPSWVKNPNILE